MLLNYLQILVFLHADKKHLHPSGCVHQLPWKIIYTVVYLHVGQKRHSIRLRLHQPVGLQQLLLRSVVTKGVLFVCLITCFDCPAKIGNIYLGWWVVWQVKKKMQVPIFYAEAVIGPSGERIEYIRRTSRSSILINNSEESIMSIEITGSAATDVLTAEQLIKVF